jgi:hypothetical protein
MNKRSLARIPRRWEDNIKLDSVILGAVIVIVLVIESKVFGLKNPAEDDGFLRAIKIRSTTSFGREVLLAACRKILRNVKEL